MNYTGRETLPRRAGRLPPSHSSSSTSSYQNKLTSRDAVPDVGKTRSQGTRSMFRSISSSGTIDALHNDDIVNGITRLYLNDFFKDVGTSLLDRRNSRHCLNGRTVLDKDNDDNCSGYESNGNISLASHSSASFPYQHITIHRPERVSRVTMPEPGEKIIFRRRASSTSAPLPANRTSAAPAERTQAQMFNANNKQDVIRAIDKLDERISFLREIVLELCDEKSKLFDALAQIHTTCSSANLLSEVDRQDILASKSALMQRLTSVEIKLRPNRSPSQESALRRAESYINELDRALTTNAPKMLAKRKCLSYISSCSSDGANEWDCSDTPIDETFQKTIISCSLQDQKEIRKRLEAILANLQNTKTI